VKAFGYLLLAALTIGGLYAAHELYVLNQEDRRR